LAQLNSDYASRRRNNVNNDRPRRIVDFNRLLRVRREIVKEQRGAYC
jgi:hypothetical protein